MGHRRKSNEAARRCWLHQQLSRRGVTVIDGSLPLEVLPILAMWHRPTLQIPAHSTELPVSMSCDADVIWFLRFFLLIGAILLKATLSSDDTGRTLLAVICAWTFFYICRVNQDNHVSQRSSLVDGFPLQLGYFNIDAPCSHQMFSTRIFFAVNVPIYTQTGSTKYWLGCCLWYLLETKR